MARLLMVESWVRSTGLGLPPAITDAGHEFVLLARDPQIYADHALPGTPHPVLALASQIVITDTNDVHAAADAATRLHEQTPFDGVLTTCDYYLDAVAHIAAHLGLPGTDRAAIHIATDKFRVRQALDRAGLPNARFRLAHSPSQARHDAAALGYPLVVKPVDLNSSTLVRRVDTDAELDAAVAAIAAHRRNTRDQPLRGAALLEELLTGPEVSVEAVTVQGHTTVIGITDKTITAAPSFVESGHMFPAELPRPVWDSVVDLVERALIAIGYNHGLSHTEVMLTPRGPRIVEINNRQGGNYIFELIGLVTGTSVLQTMVNLALGRVPQLSPVLPGRAHPPPPGGADLAGSAAVFFIMSPRDGALTTIRGLERLTGDPHVLRYTLPDTPLPVRRPRDNEDYLGRVIATDRHGGRARCHAEAALAQLRLVFDDGAELAPLGLPEVPP